MNSHERATIRKCSKCGAETENFSKKSVWCKSCVSTYDKEIYQRKRAKILEQNVDHVIPLFGVEVCGLNVHTNMRVIPAKENHKKSNKLIEDIV